MSETPHDQGSLQRKENEQEQLARYPQTVVDFEKARYIAETVDVAETDNKNIREKALERGKVEIGSIAVGMVPAERTRIEDATNRDVIAAEQSRSTADSQAEAAANHYDRVMATKR